ncbi:23379_t:CDS:2 [Dentiscutata erythropus]|uniref:23379_t:CDS:1 n=1 Tax=Dentiscutata erythropus TaxID=1348616 RepID=A0A9N9GBS0_9GLOM|nr:23379_t:CDS:2 [Dentiscutata erythropus]
MSQEYQQHPFPPTFQSERSWSMLANDFDDDKLQHYYPSQASDRSWSVLGSQDISDRHHGLSTYGYVSDDVNLPNSTGTYERNNENGIAGRPNEYVDDDCSDCPPPPSDIDQSALNSQSTISQSKTESKNSWGIGYLSIIVLVIAVILYYIGVNIAYLEIEDILH